MTRSTADTMDETTDPVELTEESRHRLLAADRCRVALDVLSGRAPPVDLEELAVAVAARESDGFDGDAVESDGFGGNAAERDAIEDEPPRRAAIALHHNHLPRIDDHGLIDYDPDAKRVESCRIDSF